MKSKKDKKAAQADSTHITIILDRTGSMDDIKEDTIGGFNSFLEKQQAAPGRATMTLVQFDSQDPYEVLHKNKPVADIPRLDAATYVPRATTPLLDAIGRGINDLASQLADAKPAERPSKVVMAVITDGQENASKEYTKDRVQKLIKEKEAEGWQFVFLSADLDAIGDAMADGFRASRVMAFDKTGKGTRRMFDALSSSVACYRVAKRMDLRIKAADRAAQEAEGRRKRGK